MVYIWGINHPLLDYDAAMGALVAAEINWA